MSRLRGSDWDLEIRHDGGLTPWTSALPRCLLTVLLTRSQARDLADSWLNPSVARYRGSPLFSSHDYAPDLVLVKEIELTLQEAERIVNGADPREVLFGPAWDCGYRLVAVPENLT